MMRSRFENAGQPLRKDHVELALHEIRRDAGKLRTFRSQRSKNFEANYHGPNYMWCVDGHDKLAVRYGIGVYACIDAYSRKILWAYVGNCHKRQIAICKLHMTAVRQLNYCPRWMRSDYGREVPLVSELHHTLHKIDLLSDPPEDFDPENCTLDNSWIHGTSVRNNRIEASWGQMLQRLTISWVVS
jgi:hypothetical protein